MVRLSVLIAAFDAQDHIAEALQSVFAQGMDGIEAIVVDDGSRDATARIVEELAAAAPKGVRVRLVRKDSNEGLAAARNTALSEARGDRIVFLDADDVLAPDCLAVLSQQLDASPTARLVVPRYRWICEDGSDFGHASPVPVGDIGVETILLGTPIHSDSGVMTTREALAAIGSFDTRLTGYIGADMWLRFAIRHGPGAIVFAPGAEVKYRRHDRQITADWQRMDRNWTAVLAKLDSQHREAIAPVRAKAVARHKLFCSALAYKQGDYRASRRVLAAALRAEPLMLARNPAARTRLLACGASLLPERLHARMRAMFG
ncbi:MAG: glycosyltransferase family 2 protein [Erythrobacter sp.]|uniref:glycosyltransferase family 2 protein n=1 Tax=Erythrobacter sp. TaxID=1042 RepID=UPI003C7608BC